MANGRPDPFFVLARPSLHFLPPLLWALGSSDCQNTSKKKELCLLIFFHIDI